MKKGSGLLDATMGKLDKAEVSEVVRRFLLYKLSQNCNTKGIGIYRDDGLRSVYYFLGKKIQCNDNSQLSR